jgi:hypothetical protein
MAKKIAVIVRDRPDEALRMSIGLIVLDDKVEIFVTEPLSDEAGAYLNNEVKDLVSSVYTTVPLSGVEDVNQITIEEMATKLMQYDNILPY